MGPNYRRSWYTIFLFAAFNSFIPIANTKTVVVTVHTTVQVASSVLVLPPTIPTSPSYTSSGEFKDTVLRVSNEYRKAHGAEPLVWNDTLVEYSRRWAENCIWKHSDGPYGENLAFGYPNASAAVEAWGDERKYYNFDKPTGFTEKTGHFTQLVWRSTTKVGCAAINCGYTEDSHKDRRDTSDSGEGRVVPREPDGSTRVQGWYVICEYTPAGNVVGNHNEYFKENVKPRQKSSSPTSSAASSKSQPTSGAAGMGLAEWKVLMALALGIVAFERSLYT